MWKNSLIIWLHKSADLDLHSYLKFMLQPAQGHHKNTQEYFDDQKKLKWILILILMITVNFFSEPASIFAICLL